jgi:hypothetical protein
MALRRLALGFALLALACGDSASGENGGGSPGGGGGGGPTGGGECPPGETLVYHGDQIECDGFVEDTLVVPHEDFAACETPPNSACSLEDFCAVEGCGFNLAMYDADGCRRELCETNDDCGAGQICYTTTQDEGCLSTAGMACGPAEDGSCECFANAICGAESHCVDE